MALIIQKFGGTSVANIDRIKEVANIIKSEKTLNNQVIVVVSAMAGATNSLIAKCSELSRLNVANHMTEYDTILSSAEIITAGLLTLALQNNGINAISLQGWQIPINTNDTFGNALIQNINSGYLFKLLQQDITPVVTGFQGVTATNRVTTLGKGGSDTTAAIIAAALQADRCDIYTDVDGIYSADPRIVHDAKKIDSLSAQEAVELSSSGAKVLHPRAALASLRYGFEMRIISSFDNGSGTLITSQETNMENGLITAITSNKNLIKIEIDLTANYTIADLVLTFTESGLPLDQISAFTINKVYLIATLSDKNMFEEQLNILKNNNLIVDYLISTNIATVSMIGYGIKNDSSLVAQTVSCLHLNDIKILTISSSETKISLMVYDQDTEKAIKFLHQKFCL